MNWKCPVCDSEDNSSDSLRCSCGYEMSVDTIKLRKKKRPFGFTFLSFSLFWVSIAAFGGIFAFSQHTLFHKVINIGYGLTALATAIGLWKMKDWVVKAYLAWCSSVIFLMLYMQFGAYSMYRTTVTGFIAFAVFLVLMLAGIRMYIAKKMLKLQSA